MLKIDLPKFTLPLLAVLSSTLSFANPAITIVMMFPKTPDPAAVVVLTERNPGDLLAMIRNLDLTGNGTVQIKHWREEVSMACKTTGQVSSCTFSMQNSPRVSVDHAKKSFASPVLPLSDFYGADALNKNPNRLVTLNLNDSAGRAFSWTIGQGRFVIEGRDSR